ncbi:hypothetical protein Poly30_48070 [Planctomycetes bacterium Poly30]|uniref:Uncharacterized protein n=1 Tax=Saltatorellus ferox TaxID=2528018 RepID=A0A518EYT6_9BACT|nr:hypothetical protein Poly30_48070 [Planctomycetes bacterium Poly30]
MGEARSFGQVPFRPDDLSGEIGYGLVPLTHGLRFDQRNRSKRDSVKFEVGVPPS